MPSKKYHHGDLKNALIQAGIEILSKDGVSGLSLRKVAKRAGVSHSAPYAHFPDKQSLIAAISTEGFHQLYTEIDAVVSKYPRDPKRQLLEGTRVYSQFALSNPDTFKIMFSAGLEKEKEYPAFVEISQRTFGRVVDIVQICQSARVLGPGDPEALAVSIWGQVHGIVSLVLDGQISHTVLDRHTVQDLVSFSIQQMVLP